MRKLLTRWQGAAVAATTSSIMFVLLGLAPTAVATSLSAQSTTSATTFTVNSTADDPLASSTATTCQTAAGQCTLRAAIQAADNVGGQVVIDFAIQGSGPFQITPASALPTITVPLTIDGYSQSGSAPATASSPAKLAVELIGPLGSGASGFRSAGLTLGTGAQGSEIEGLEIGGFYGFGITSQADGVQISGNQIGDQSHPNQLSAIHLQSTVGDVVGGSDPAARNVIGYVQLGGGVLDQDGTADEIAGNYIGTDATGRTAAELTHGIGLFNTTGDGVLDNVVAGNSSDGIDVNGGSGATIAGNLVGVGAGGETPLGNGADGISVDNSPKVTIGGTSSADRNVVSANGAQGITVVGSSDGIRILGNYIGTDAAGSAFDANVGPLEGSPVWGNRDQGILVSGVNDAVIGAPGAGNVLDSNDFTQEGATDLAQITVEGGSASPVIQSNRIGVRPDGSGFGIPALGVSDGIVVQYGSDATIGGPQAGDGNIVGDMQDAGIVLFGETGGAIQDNLLGTDAAGTAAAPDNPTEDGEIVLDSSSQITVGGARPGPSGTCANGATCSAAWRALGPGNLIAASGEEPGGRSAYAISVDGGPQSPTQDNTIQGNLIGTDITGEEPLPNLACGIVLSGGASSTLIGGPGAGEGNVISANGNFGLEVEDVSATTIQGNLIGTDLAGAKALPNVDDGVGLIANPANGTGPQGTLIGGPEPGEGNVISGNGHAAFETAQIGLGGSGDPAGTVTNTTIEGNRIGASLTGASLTTSLPAHSDGITVNDGVSDLAIGGTSTGDGNLISGNGFAGISLLAHNGQASGISIQGNLIGTNGAGSGPLPNGTDGIHIAPDSPAYTIGGTGPGEANTIAYNDRDGVLVDASNQATIRGNSIYANGSLAIALIDGANNSEPSPTLTSAVQEDSTVTLTGTFQGAPNSSYHLDFYSNPAGASGQAQRWEGSEHVQTDATGQAPIAFRYSGAPTGAVSTATATDSSGDTSELSAPLAASAPASPGSSETATTPTTTPTGTTATTPGKPAPAPRRAARITIASQVAPLRRGRVRITLACAPHGRVCLGTLRIAIRRRITLRVHGRRERRWTNIVLAHRRFRVNPGARRTFVLRLDRAAIDLLGPNRRLRVNVQASLTGRRSVSRVVLVRHARRAAGDRGTRRR